DLSFCSLFVSICFFFFLLDSSPSYIYTLSLHDALPIYKLVLSPGAKPIRPNLEGVDKPHVFTVRNVTDVEQIQSFVQQNEVKNIAVIGGGFIAVEVADNLPLAGHNVSIM